MDKSSLLEDLNEIVSMATGEDGGGAFIFVRQFVMQCEADGKDVTFLRQMAKLCRMMKERID